MSTVPTISAQELGKLWFSFFVQMLNETAVPLPMWPRRCGKSHVMHRITQMATRLGELLHNGISTAPASPDEIVTLNYHAGTFWLSQQGKPLGESLQWPFYHASELTLASRSVSSLKYVLDCAYPEHAFAVNRYYPIHEFIGQPDHRTRLTLRASDWTVEVFGSGVDRTGALPHGTEPHPTAHAGA